MQNLYEHFLHKNFYTRYKLYDSKSVSTTYICKLKEQNYSNRAVIYVNHTKIFLYKNFYHEKFLHKNKANYGTIQLAIMTIVHNFHSDLTDCKGVSRTMYNRSGRTYLETKRDSHIVSSKSY